MTEQSSLTSPTPSAFYDPASSCWRTSQGSLLSEEYPLLERLPDWGTTADGALCVQATPEHLTAVRDGSASPNLPTPVVNDMGRGKTISWWDDWTAKIGGHGDSLDIEVRRLLPPPTTVDSKVFGPNVDWQLRRANHAPHTASVLMNLPSNDGNGSSDDPHQPRPIVEDCDPSSPSG